MTKFRNSNGESPIHIQVGAAIFAFICAPLVIGVLGYVLGMTVWDLAGIAAFAVVFGSLPYALFFPPFMIFFLRAGYTNPFVFAFAGLLANFCFWVLASIYDALFSVDWLFSLTATFGFIFAPLWGGAFGLIYFAIKRRKARQ